MLEQGAMGTQNGYCGRTKVYHSTMEAGEVPSDGMDLVTYLFRRRAGDGAAVAVVDGRSGRKLTYSALEETVRVVAAGLVERLGVAKGDVVGVLSPNSVEFGVLFLAAASLGVVTSAVNPLNTDGDIRKLFRNAGRSMLLQPLALSTQLESSRFALNWLLDCAIRLILVLQVRSTSSRCPHCWLRRRPLACLWFSSTTTRPASPMQRSGCFFVTRICSLEIRTTLPGQIHLRPSPLAFLTLLCFG